MEKYHGGDINDIIEENRRLETMIEDTEKMEASTLQIHFNALFFIYPSQRRSLAILHLNAWVNREFYHKCPLSFPPQERINALEEHQKNQQQNENRFRDYLEQMQRHKMALVAEMEKENEELAIVSKFFVWCDNKLDLSI